MLTSAEDVLWDAEARLGFPPWDWLWLAHMLMVARFFSLCLSLHKIFCSIEASKLAFHRLLALKCVGVTKEKFWQSTKTDCHNSLVFKKLLTLLPHYFLWSRDCWLVAAWENQTSGKISEGFSHSNLQTVTENRECWLGVLKPLWLKTSCSCGWIKPNHKRLKANNTSASPKPGRKLGTMWRCKVSR